MTDNDYVMLVSCIQAGLIMLVCCGLWMIGQWVVKKIRRG